MSLESILLATVFGAVIFAMCVVIDSLRYSSRYGGKLVVIVPPDPYEDVIHYEEGEQTNSDKVLENLNKHFKKRGEDALVIMEPTAKELIIKRV